jgi:hypothetical protein
MPTIAPVPRPPLLLFILLLPLIPLLADPDVVVAYNPDVELEAVPFNGWGGGAGAGTLESPTTLLVRIQDA